MKNGFIPLFVTANNKSNFQSNFVYITRWDRYKENIVTSKEYYKVDMIMKTDYHGLVVKIDNEWFSAYHVLPVTGYDMI